jgi:hypothetical protein
VGCFRDGSCRVAGYVPVLMRLKCGIQRDNSRHKAVGGSIPVGERPRRAKSCSLGSIHAAVSFSSEMQSATRLFMLGGRTSAASAGNATETSRSLMISTESPSRHPRPSSIATVRGERELTVRQGFPPSCVVNAVFGGLSLSVDYNLRVCVSAATPPLCWSWCHAARRTRRAAA